MEEETEMSNNSLKDEHIEEIVKVFAEHNEYNPSAGLLEALATASGKMKGSIKQRYREIYKEIHDDDPYGPVPTVIG